MTAAPSPTCIVIDGQCPICALYGRQVSSALPTETARIIDGRISSPEKAQATAAGIDVDDGMVAITPDGLIAGRAALVYLSRNLPTGSSWLLRLCAALFRHELLAILAYPLFKGIRRIALWGKGVGPIARASSGP